MASAANLARGLATLAYFFGAAPGVAIRIRTTTHTQEGARMLALEHLRRTRLIAGMSLRVSGEEHVPAHGGLVLVFNETSFADLFATVEVLWRYTSCNVIAAEFAHVPFIRPAVEQAGFVLMPRGNRGATDRVLAQLTEYAAAGGRISVAAQGRVSAAPGVAHFKRGAFLIAIRARVPLVPMAVRGGREILPPGSLTLHPGSIRCRFGEPISTRAFMEDDAPALAEATRRTVERLFEEIGVADE